MIPLCLPDILQHSYEQYPANIAVVYHDQRLSYTELHARVTEVATTLLRLGVRNGEPVLIAMANSAEFIVAFFAIAKAGGIIVPINRDLSLREFEYIVGHCDAKVLLTVTESRKLLHEILPQLASPQTILLLNGEPTQVREEFAQESGLIARICFPQAPAPEAQDLAFPRLIDVDDAVIIYTSGTAGPPKGVLLTHLNLMSSVRSVGEFLRLTADDTGLICLPLFHVYTLSQLLTHLMCGGTVVLVENFAFPGQVLRLIAQEHVTGLGGVPAAFQLLLNASDHAHDRLTSLRYLLNSGGPLSQQMLVQLIEAFPQAEIISAYGLTEASSRVSHAVYKKGGTRRLGSVGRAMPNVEVRVVNAEGGDVKPGEVGEIVIRGSTVMKGYFKDPAATAGILESDGLHTGDFATLDEEGDLYIVGRRDDILNPGGQRTSAREVEEVLLSHPGVLEAAVVGKPDAAMGEAIHAFLVLRSEVLVSVDEIKEHCVKHLSRYKVPREYVVCDALPKTPSGKVQKHVLRRG
jgi:long-chain acyl-CoA synthetase